MYSVILVDDNANWLETLESAINRESNFKVVEKARNGQDALQKIGDHRPDIIILDVVMPEFDGAYVVNAIRTSMPDYHPIIYVISGIGTDTTIKILNDLAIDFYSMKPIPLDKIIESLKKITRLRGQMVKHLKLPDTEEDSQYRQKIREIVYALGVPPHLFSTKCLIETIFIYCTLPENDAQLTKVIYPQVARNMDVSKSSIEKNLRSAITQMQNAKTDTYRKLFPYAQNKKITNGEFLLMIAEYMRSTPYF